MIQGQLVSRTEKKKEAHNGGVGDGEAGRATGPEGGTVGDSRVWGAVRGVADGGPHS